MQLCTLLFKGSTIGIHVLGDLNDQPDYHSCNNDITWRDSSVGKLVGGSGKEAMAVKTENFNLKFGGLVTDDPVDLSNHLKPPKVLINYGVYSKPLIQQVFSQPDSFEDIIKDHSSVNTEEKMMSWRDKCMNYIRTMYGINIPNNLSSYSISDTINVSDSDTSIQPYIFDVNVG